MKINCAYDDLIPISKLKPHPKNPNKHTEAQIERLAQILEYQGWRCPIKVSNLSGFIIAGHGRLLAAQKNGYDKVPIDYQDFESEEQEYASLVSDNSIAQWANLDLAQVNTEVVNLGPDFDIDLLGIKDFTLDVSEKFLNEDDLQSDDTHGDDKKFFLEIECADESHMVETYKKLSEEGLLVRVK